MGSLNTFLHFTLKFQDEAQTSTQAESGQNLGKSQQIPKPRSNFNVLQPEELVSPNLEEFGVTIVILTLARVAEGSHAIDDIGSDG